MINIIIILLLISIFFLYSKRKNPEIVSYVYMHPKTKKYHQEGCPHAKGLNPIHLKIAVRNGYTPCKICNRGEII